MLRARSEGQREAPPVGFDMLRKYLAYSRRLEPKLTDEAMEVLVEFYADLRSRAPPEAIAITPRQLESLARLTVARARLLLRDRATREDAEAAVRLMKISLRGMGIDVESGEVDMGELYGYPMKERNRMKVAIEIMRRLEDPKTGLIPAKQLIQELAEKLEVDEEEARRLVEKLWRAGYMYEHERGYYKRTSA
ncbi:MAG: hypothetical protein RXP77_02015 [Nitrososphaeria archaeon]